jgi:dTDP-4-amino-4,6-dideoxygalactose transaminase
LAFLLLELGPGDEVITPSFTFVSTVNAFVLRGAKPIFVDIREDTLNLDDRLISEHLTERTRAIVPVHYAGVSCEMDEINQIIDGLPIEVVEDNAHGLFGSYRGQPLGTFGRMATLSFHETKNVSCGEGGALIVNDPELLLRAEIAREKGTNRTSFHRGEVDKYSWVGLGSSYLPSDILAAVLCAQLEEAHHTQMRRGVLWNNYMDSLGDWALERGYRLPIVPADRKHPYHMFYMITPSSAERDALIRHLGGFGILSVFHYVPLHSAPAAQVWGGSVFDLPVTDRVSSTLVRLPLFADLSAAEQARVIQAVLSFRFAG